MATPIIFLLAINCKKKKCFIFNILRDTAHSKSLTFANDYKVLVSPRVLKIEKKYFLQLKANKK